MTLPWISNEFLGDILKAQVTKEKTDKLNFIKLKNSLCKVVTAKRKKQRSGDHSTQNTCLQRDLTRHSFVPPACLADEETMCPMTS